MSRLNGMPAKPMPEFFVSSPPTDLTNVLDTCRREVARTMGYGDDLDALTPEQRQTVEQCVTRTIGTFENPPDSNTVIVRPIRDSETDRMAALGSLIQAVWLDEHGLPVGPPPRIARSHNRKLAEAKRLDIVRDRYVKKEVQAVRRRATPWGS